MTRLILPLLVVQHLFISCQSYSTLPLSLSKSLTRPLPLPVQHCYSGTSSALRLRVRASQAEAEVQAEVPDESSYCHVKKQKVIPTSTLFSKDDIASAKLKTDGNNSNSMSRRDAIFSTTTTMAATASSLIFLQPSSSRAEDIGSGSGSESSEAASTSKNSVQLNSQSCSSSSSSSSSKPFPLASFGLQIYDDEKAYKLTLTALEAGYRNFFASVLAGNQKGFARAIRDSTIPLSELYICGTVLSNRAQGYKAAYAKTMKGCDENLSIMSQYGNINKLDMIMLDYPGVDEDSIRGQWDSFQDFQRSDSVVDLAVSNFNGKQLDCILEGNDKLCARPTVNQLPFSIANHPKRYMDENEARGIHVQSWSPLSTTLPKYKELLTTIGKKYEKSAAQVGLRWIVQSGGSYCVQSQNGNHFKEDLDVFDFNLSAGDMERLNHLEPPRLLG